MVTYPALPTAPKYQNNDYAAETHSFMQDDLLTKATAAKSQIETANV